MFGVNDIQITLYFVGTDVDDAQLNFPFDSAESARSYADDNPGTHIYSAAGLIDLTTLELEAD